MQDAVRTAFERLKLNGFAGGPARAPDFALEIEVILPRKRLHRALHSTISGTWRTAPPSSIQYPPGATRCCIILTKTSKPSISQCSA